MKEAVNAMPDRLLFKLCMYTMFRQRLRGASVVRSCSGRALDFAATAETSAEVVSSCPGPLLIIRSRDLPTLHSEALNIGLR